MRSILIVAVSLAACLSSGTPVAAQNVVPAHLTRVSEVDLTSHFNAIHAYNEHLARALRMRTRAQAETRWAFLKVTGSLALLSGVGYVFLNMPDDEERDNTWHYAGAGAATGFAISMLMLVPDNFQRRASAREAEREALARARRIAADRNPRTGHWSGIPEIIPPASTAGPPHLPALRAHVLGLRFYEQGTAAVPLRARRHSTRFARSDTRFISAELELSYPRTSQGVDVTILCTYTGPAGRMGTVEIKTQVPAGWSGSYHSAGRGWESPGQWPVGRYDVDCTHGGRRIASRSFEVH